MAEGREEMIRRKVSEVMREREGDFRGKEKRIQIVSITWAVNKKKSQMKLSLVYTNVIRFG